MKWSTQTKAGTLIVAMLVLLSGCIKYEGEVKIEDDGSGRIDALIAMDGDSLLGSLAEFGMDDGVAGTDFCQEMRDEGVDEIPPEAEVTEYDEDGFCGYRIKLDMEPSDDHSAIVGEFWGDEASNTQLYKDGEEWVFSSLMDLGEITDDEMMPAEMMEMIFAETSINLVIDLPGTPIDGEHNADSASNDGRFEWEIDLFNAPDRLFARTEPGGGGGLGGILRAVLALAILAGLAALGWLAFQKFARGGGGADMGATPDVGGFGSPDADLTASAGQSLADLGPPATPAADLAPPQMPGAEAATSIEDPVVRPIDGDDHASAETVIVNPERLADPTSVGDETVDSAADDPAAGDAGDPTWDDVRGAWIIQDPVRGLMVHDPATDTWNQAE